MGLGQPTELRAESTKVFLVRWNEEDDWHNGEQRPLIRKGGLLGPSRGGWLRTAAGGDSEDFLPAVLPRF